MKLKSDFVSDWLNLLKNILQNHWGYDIEDLTDEQLLLAYFNAEKRRPEPRQRIVKLADTFNCPSNLSDGWDRLQNLIKSGADITGNLSKCVTDLSYKDSMLNEWGIYHFHLGSEKKGEFVSRTGPLLFALVTDNEFLAINIYPHGAWTDISIVETIHRNWPDVISKYKILGNMLAYEISEKDRQTLRNKKINSFVTVDDGTIYGSIGGGVVYTGDNIHSIRKIDKQIKHLKSLEQHLQLKLEVLKDKLIQYGYAGESEVEAKLIITENEYIALFPKFNCSIPLQIKS